ncbi:MAG: deoxynucleoside kinase [candidate division KSB1 bacterium]|nr:deoxynucleoside kinase [candidate division KSB1 bacterium]MDQ7065613.1 deoxynucleoside kinase [candidate division KSB1 bacterium]
MAEREPKPLYIAIAGNIGVGKTTLTEMLCDRFGWQPFYEKVVENPYLADFYLDMRQWAFQSQIFFLKERLKDHLNIQHLEKTCIQDRTIFEDAEIFARNLYERGVMAERDFSVYWDFYETIQQFLRAPDLIIYLRASIWTLISRIRKRGRDYEQIIDKEYLMQLNMLYDKWAERMSGRHRVLVIDTDHRDVYRDIDWLEDMIGTIDDTVRELAAE